MHFVLETPPPSYDQIGNDHVVMGASPIAMAVSPSSPHGAELSEKVAAQSSVIRAQEAEIGKLKRDLGRMREQMDRIRDTAAAAEKPDSKLSQTLAQAVGEEEEERRRKRRSRKGDVVVGLGCCVALLVVLTLGLYIVLHKPPTAMSTSLAQNITTKTIDPPMMSVIRTAPVLRQFQVIGKGAADSLCWASAQLDGVERRCNIFRRSADDRRLFCAFPLEAPFLFRTEGRTRFVLPTRRGVPLIVLEDRRARVGVLRRNRTPTYVYALEEAEAERARKECAEQSPFRFSGGVVRSAMANFGAPPPPHWVLSRMLRRLD